MSKLKVYLDNCCFNRSYDNQDNLMVLLETEAKLFVQELIIKKELDLVWSFVLDYENKDNPFEERRERIITWEYLSVSDCGLCDELALKASDLMKLGLRQKDASHIACAIFSSADYFLTTGKKILNKPITNIKVVNPIEFVRRYLDE